jgi:hypothetical protein
VSPVVAGLGALHDASHAVAIRARIPQVLLEMVLGLLPGDLFACRAPVKQLNFFPVPVLAQLRFG